mmetsp:Transcript_3089/g.4172  ORF Transcript_3089/g.4172 Transcript_3089/m.4172 type:complete len:160 (+) Transcript_3089:78-557(+)|eukprot:CAMPEP_0204866088 /NCGR_PEP_ID=MMETSP1348-20121228/15773_1 /ASSEMBLY_ACC=CAM_ASM_000700 /TAXON_ID=215587 /ORGANISM="Aplanochytrium stocchinoi, Strain GSBS06" /LENGTH=159 /DNA_ID=CAMNT_0052017801 /DNA_START=66 /DNA_END=545 /DNA_ORIENTATION=+
MSAVQLRFSGKSILRPSAGCIRATNGVDTFRAFAKKAGGDPRKRGAPAKTAEERAAHKFFLGVLNAKPEELPPMSKEERERGRELASTYNKRMFRRHNEDEIIINTRAVLHRSSVQALPEELRAEAMEPDTRPFPLYRQPARWTPPIKEKGKTTIEEDS